MFTNSLVVLNQQTLRRTNHVHCFQTQFTESCLVVWFWVDKRPSCIFFLYKKQSGYPDLVLGWWWVEQFLKLPSTQKYFYLCSRCTARYTLVYTRAQTSTWSKWSVRCTIVYTNMQSCTQTCTKTSNSWSPRIQYIQETKHK